MTEAAQNLTWYDSAEAAPCPLEQLGPCVVEAANGELISPSHYDTDLGWVRSLDTEPIAGMRRFAPYQLPSPADEVTSAPDGAAVQRDE
jgi:hypothetical protein